MREQNIAENENYYLSRTKIPNGKLRYVSLHEHSSFDMEDIIKIGDEMWRQWEKMQKKNR